MPCSMLFCGNAVFTKKVSMSLIFTEVVPFLYLNYLCYCPILRFFGRDSLKKCIAFLQNKLPTYYKLVLIAIVIETLFKRLCMSLVIQFFKIKFHERFIHISDCTGVCNNCYHIQWITWDGHNSQNAFSYLKSTLVCLAMSICKDNFQMIV